MSERVALVTGANAGLGYQLARNLALKGTHVVMACRNLEKAHAALAELQAEQPAAKATVMQLDVSDLESIRAFAHDFERQVGTLDLLINNAGVLGIPLTRNRSGHELQLATNYLGAFALTGALLPHFRDGGPARIVNVGSLANRFGRIRLDNLNWNKGRYNRWLAYANSKAALLGFSLELNRRLQAIGSHVLALNAHPGYAATNIYKRLPLLNPQNRLGKWLIAKAEEIIPSANQASAAILHAAHAPNVQGGQYWGPGGFLEISGPVGPAKVNASIAGPQVGRSLWEWSEAATGIRFLSQG